MYSLSARVDGQQDEIVSYSQIAFSAIKEYLFSWIGMEPGTRTRNLYEKGGEYLSSELVKETENGHATVQLPFSFLPSFIMGPIKYITIITDPQLAKQIGSYGVTSATFDSNVRVPFYITRILMRRENVVSRNDSNVRNDRSKMKSIMHDSKRISEVIHNEFTTWYVENKNQVVNLEDSLKKVLIRTLGKSLLGMHQFPPNNDEVKFSLGDMINLLDDIDEAMTLLNIERMKELEPIMMDKYSVWLFENNIETITSKDSIVPHLVGDVYDSYSVNVANLFLVTPNVTKLTYLSVIFFAIHQEWQDILRSALKNKEENKITLRNIYMELARLFIPTNIPRFASRPTTFEGQEGPLEFPANTMFYIMGRSIRMDPERYPEPEKFNPDRFLDNNIRMNSVELSPFGIGPRQCPASGMFTEKFWLKIMEVVFLNNRVEIEGDVEFEHIPEDTRHISLENEYHAKIIPLN